MNTIKLYRFLLHGPPEEVQLFFADYDLHLSKVQVKQLQRLLVEIPFYELTFPLSKKITDDVKAIIGDKKYKQLNKLLQQYME